jgi:hypothetical protein
MALINQGGKLLLQNGALASGEACCCGGGTCCLPDGTCGSGLTQAQCEACETTITCFEETYPPCTYAEQDENGQCPEGFVAIGGGCLQCEPCPEGWSGSDGYCYRVTNPATCDDCAGSCTSQEEGVCGEWKGGVGCDLALCQCLGMEDEEQLILELNAVPCDEAGLAAWVDFLESSGWANVRYQDGPFGTTAFYGLCCGPWSYVGNAPAGTNGYLCGGAPAGQAFRVCANPLPEWFTNPFP